MKILVTGSNGMLGTDLCRVLAKDHAVVGIDIRDSGSKTANHAFYNVSITNAGGIREILEKERPSIVIHAAAWTDVDGCQTDTEKAEAVNVRGTQILVNAVRGRNIPLVFISTDFVFDGEKHEPYTEDDSPSPISVYGRTKYEAEEIIRVGLTSYTIVRTSWLFGKNGDNFIDTIVSKAESEKKLKVVNDQTGSPTYTEDFSLALKKLSETKEITRQNIFHVSNSGQCSRYEIAQKVVDHKGIKEVSVEPITSEALNRPAPRPCFSVLDNRKFNKATGYTLRPWQEAVEEYLRGKSKIENRK